VAERRRNGAVPLSIWNLFYFLLSFLANYKVNKKSVGSVGGGGGIEEKPAAEEEENPLQLALEKFLALIDLL